ncbi:tail fiber domain-containing protein [Salmonella enterica]
MADIVWRAPDGTERGRLWIGGTIGADNSLTWRSGSSGAFLKIYHEGNKPTAADVGAAPAGFGLGGYGTGLSSVLGDTPLRRQSGFFQGPYIEGLPTSSHIYNYVFSQAHGNPSSYFGYLAISFAGTQAWIGGQEGGTQKGPFELVKQNDRFVAQNAVGNDYNQCAIEVNGNTAIDSRPGIGFHMPGRFAGTLNLWEGGDFRFHTQGLASYAGIVTGNVNANDVYIRSDRRLKKNLVEVQDALRKVSSLTAYSYDKKQTLEATEYDKKEVGLIAQDVEQVLPEAVTRVVDSSNKDGTEILTLSNSALIALLVGAVKELSEKVKELEYGRT